LASLLSSYEEAHHKRDGIISDVIDGIIILNPIEEASSGDKRIWWSSGDMNSDFSGCVLEYPLD
jgi:hypothetical protein